MFFSSIYQIDEKIIKKERTKTNGILANHYLTHDHHDAHDIIDSEKLWQLKMLLLHTKGVWTLLCMATYEKLLRSIIVSVETRDMWTS